MQSLHLIITIPTALLEVRPVSQAHLVDVEERRSIVEENPSHNASPIDGEDLHLPSCMSDSVRIYGASPVSCEAVFCAIVESVAAMTGKEGSRGGSLVYMSEN